MSNISKCQICGSDEVVRYGEFSYAIGLLVAVIKQRMSGWFCSNCARRTYRKTLLLNLTVGVPSGLSLIVVPIFLFANRRCYARMNREFAADASPASENLPADQAAVRSLPWASLMDVPEDLAIGQRALTWPVTVGTFIAFGLLIFLPVTFIPTDNPLMPFNISLAGSVLLLCGLAVCIYCHRRKRNRPDWVPDILAKVFPKRVILQTHRVHLIGFAFQSGASWRLFIGLQNLFDQPTEFRASFSGDASTPELLCNLSPSEVALATVDVSVKKHAISSVTHFSLSARTSGSGGNRIRFAARRAFLGQSRTRAISIAEAAGGHFQLELSDNRPGAGICFVEADGTLQARMLPVKTEMPQGTSEPWTVKSLWRPQQSKPIAICAEMILEMLRETT